MTFAVRLPDIAVKTRFFAQFTPRDLVRLGLPILVLGALFYAPATAPVRTLGAIGVGLLLGLLWYGLTWEHQHLDQHLLHALRWLSHQHLNDTATPQDLATHHDHVTTTDGVVGIIEISPTELDLKTRDQQQALHTHYKQLLDGLSHPVELHSVQEPLDLSTYLNRLEGRVDTPDDLIAAYRQYCRQLDTGDTLQTTHYLTVPVSPATTDGVTELLHGVDPRTDADTSRVDPDQLTDELDDRCRYITNHLNATDLEARRVTGPWLESVASQLQPHTGEPDRRYTATGDQWTRTLIVTDYPDELRFGWPLPLFRLPGQLQVTQRLDPCQTGDVVPGLERKLEQVAGEIESFLAGGHLGTQTLQQQKRDIEWLLELFASGSDTPVRQVVSVSVTAGTQAQCDDAVRELTNWLNARQISYREPVFQTDQARHTGSIRGGAPVGERTLMPSRSAASGFPFGTAQTSYRSGVIYGQDAADGTPVLLDRFQWASHSMAVMGMTGSGKSYLAKLELLRSYLAYPDVSIAIFDPKKEYSDVVQALGGVVTVQGPDATHDVRDYSGEEYRARVASYEVPERGQAENVAILVDLLQEVYQAVSQQNGRSLVFIDEARILLNDSEGRNLLNQFVLEARDTDTAVTMLTQNASHFTHSRQGREILNNVPGKVLMQHDTVHDSVTQYFQLSQQEVTALSNLKTGTDCDYSEGLLKVSNQLDTKLRIQATPTEHEVIDG